MIKGNFEYINKEAFEVLYGMLVRPQLKYAVHLWSLYQIGLREKLQQFTQKNNKIGQKFTNIKVMKKDCPL